MTHDLLHAAELGELVEHQANAVADARIGIEIDGPIRLPNIASGQVLDEFAAFRFRKAAGIEPQPQAMKFRFGYRSFQSEQKPIVEIPRMINPVDVSDQGVEQSAQF